MHLEGQFQPYITAWESSFREVCESVSFNVSDEKGASNWRHAF